MALNPYYVEVQKAGAAKPSADSKKKALQVRRKAAKAVKSRKNTAYKQATKEGELFW